MTESGAEDRRDVPATETPDHSSISDLEHQAARVEELAAEVERYRDQLRDYEKTLVERIADVDDDRRRTATTLQRAWQTEEEALNLSLRRWGAFTLAGLILFAILVSAALFWMNRQLESDRISILEEVSQIKLDRERAAQTSGAVDDRVQGRLAELAADVRAISAAVEGLKGEQGRLVRVAVEKEQASREEGDARLGKELKRLEAERLTQQAGLKEALAAEESVKKESERIVQAVLDKERAARKEVDARILDQIKRLEAEQKTQQAGIKQALVAEEAVKKESERLVQAALERQRAARGEPDAQLTARLQRLEAETQRLTQGLESLQRAGQRTETAPAKKTEASVPIHAHTAETAPPAMETVPKPETASEMRAAAEGTGASDAGEPEAKAGAGAGAEPSAGEAMVIGERLYGLQLIGFHGLDALERFAARKGLPARMYYIEETHKGRPWYALIHSLHNDYAGAEETLAGLSGDLTALAPWMRPLPAGTRLWVLEIRPE